MARTKLTAGRIRDFACPTGKAQAFLWDSEARRLQPLVDQGTAPRQEKSERIAAIAQAERQPGAWGTECNR